MGTAPFVTEEFLGWLNPERPDYESARKAVILAYNSETGANVDPSVPSDDKSLIPIVYWLNRLQCDGVDTWFYARRPMLTRQFYSSILSKVMSLGQFYCDICRSSTTIVTIPIRIRPRSHQAASPKVKAAFKRALEQRLGTAHNYSLQRLCIHMTVACRQSSRTGDLDNIAKLLLDSMKNIVFEDDGQVDHLNVLRVQCCGDEDYLILRIGGSTLNQHRDVIYAGAEAHSWAGRPPLDLEDFM